MDFGFQTSRTFVPYSPCSFGAFVGGSPSPPLSLCSEPILQNPMPDGQCRSPRVPLKNRKMQLLNKTVVGARRNRSNLPRTNSKIISAEHADMANFFQSVEQFSDLSDTPDGGIRNAQINSLYSYSNAPVQFPLTKTPTLHYPPVTKPVQCIQPEKSFKNVGQHTFCQLPNQPVHSQSTQKKSWENPTVWAQPSKMDEDRVAKVKKNKRAASKANSGKKPRRKTRENVRKKRLISTTKDVLKKAERKQSKKVQQKNKSLHKTELCTHFTLTSTCLFNEKCFFAHGIRELKKRVRVGNFKTQPCVDCPREKSRCMFGSRCNYCHPGEALRRTVGSAYYDVNYYKKLKIEFPNIDYPFGILV